ncbi:MAG: 50S ribosomal protein L19e [Candidatus Pacearchaeota archaeon]
MKTLRSQRRMAAQILKVGINRVWFDPERLQEIKEAVTKQDIIDLIKDKAIKKKPAKGRKKRAHKRRVERKRKGRRRGKGKRKKTVKKRKQNYVKKIRKLRRYLKELKKVLPKEEYRKLKRWVKGGKIREVKELMAFKNENKI